MLRQAFLATFLALGSLAISADKASAVVVTVRGNQYDVTTFQGSYNDNTSKFNTPPSGVMPWWGDQQLSFEFMQAVGGSLGYNNSGSIGPLFAWGTRTIPGDPDFGIPDTTFTRSSVLFSSSFQNNDELINLASDKIYAQVQPPQVQSVPAPLPIFGAAAALSCTQRFRRNSQKLSKLAKKLG